MMSHSEFQTALVDCPWNEQGGGKIPRGAQHQYDLIKTKHEMLATIVRAEPWQRLAHSAHMYIWITDNHLHQGVWLVDALGFKIKRSLPWTKEPPFAIGQYFRGEHEVCYFAVRGKGYSVRTAPKNIGTGGLIGAPRIRVGGKLKHSAKPVEQYALIERRSKGPYLEMFARRDENRFDPGPEWTFWGRQANV